MSAAASILNACTNAWNAGDLSTCKPLGFDLVGWIGILTGAVAFLYFAVRHFRNWVAPQRTATLKARPWRSRFRALCAAIRPIMDENGRIFREFGPNSGRGNGAPKLVRQDVTVWKQLLPKVVTNNARIRELITANRQSIPPEQAPLFQDWVNHIDAFEAHASDDLADYRNNQFPAEVVELVHRNA